MKLLVIGDPEREEKDRPLVEKGKYHFSDCLYAPIDNITVEVGYGTRIAYKKIDLKKFDCVIPIPTSKYKDLFLAVVCALEYHVQMPYSFRSLMLFQHAPALLSKLKELEFQSMDFTFSISEAFPLQGYPATIVIGDNVMEVENEKGLKNVSKLRKPGQGIFVKEIMKGDITECLVMGNEVVGCIQHSEKKAKSVNIGLELQRQARHIIKFLGSSYGSVTMAGNKITSVSIAPDFSKFQKITGKDIASPLIENMMHNARKDMTVIDTLIEFIRGKIR